MHTQLSLTNTGSFVTGRRQCGARCCFKELPLSIFKLAAAAAVLLGLGSAVAPAQAAPIARADFGPGEITYDFDMAANGSTTPTDGVLTVSNGATTFVGAPFGLLSNLAYRDNGSGAAIRFSFAGAVSAVGVDFISNRSDVTLRLYDAGDTLLDSTTIGWTTLPLGLGFAFPTGFVGLDLGLNVIAYATIDTAVTGDGMFLDNVIYQSTPEPASLALLGLGTLALAGFRRRTAAG